MKTLNTFEVALKTKQLPTTAKELVPLSFIGAEAVKFYRNRIKTMSDLNMTDEQKKKTLKDGQDAGIMLLEIERRIGEIAETIPKNQSVLIRDSSGRIVNHKPSGKKNKVEILGLKDRKQIHIAKTIKDNQKTVQRVIDEAIANDDIPTKTAVVNQVRYENEKKRRKKAEKNKVESKIQMSADELTYITQLERVIALIPQKPPKNFSEGGFNMCKGYAKIITKRLSYFLDDTEMIGE